MIVERASGNGRSGFVLITVLSVLALLSGLVLALLLLSRNAVDSASVAGDHLADEAMAQAGIAMAGYQLFVLKLPADRIDGQRIRLKQGTVSLSISTDAGKVDLNGAGKELLSAAYRASGLRSMSPEGFAARVIDWRDPDDETSVGGAEAADYAAAGLGAGPRNGTFRSVDDLRSVDAIAPADLDLLRPFVTVDNPGGRLDMVSVAPTLLAALPGVTPSVAAQVVSLRGTRGIATTAKLKDLLLVQSALIYPDSAHAYRISLDLHANGASRRKQIDAIMTAGIDAAQPYRVLEWSARN